MDYAALAPGMAERDESPPRYSAHEPDSSVHMGWWVYLRFVALLVAQAYRHTRIHRFQIYKNGAQANRLSQVSGKM
jgi:hypothetical protein